MMAFRRNLRQFMDDNCIIGSDGCIPALLDAVGGQDRRFIQKQLSPKSLKDKIAKDSSRFFEETAGELVENFEAMLTDFVRDHFWFQPHLFLPIVSLKFGILPPCVIQKNTFAL
jgi:hypothetical protein